MDLEVRLGCRRVRQTTGRMNLHLEASNPLRAHVIEDVSLHT